MITKEVETKDGPLLLFLSEPLEDDEIELIKNFTRKEIIFLMDLNEASDG